MPVPKKSKFDISSIDVNKLIASLGDVAYLIGDHIQETLSIALNGLNKGIMPKNVLNLPPDTVEQIYTKAYNFYNQGKYKEASIIFQLLILLDPTVPKYMLGSAACLHRMELYEKAAQVYLLTAALDPENPLLHFHASDCYMKLHAPELALLELKNTIACAKDKQEFQIVKERAMMMLETVQAQIQARKEEKNTEAEDKGGAEPIS
jgi:type III secretion system low calcium response chaperone LcrH/SycD